jgi:putative phosphoesterase
VRLGIIADTHGLLRPEVFSVFQAVDRIFHAGDIGSLDILSDLEAVAPVTAVYGNTDGFALRDRLAAAVEVEVDGFRIVLTHGDAFGVPTPDKLNLAYPEAEIILFGHTHRPLLTIVDTVVTVMNPGAAGPRRFDLQPSVGIMELEAGIPPRARIVPLTPAG